MSEVILNLLPVTEEEKAEFEAIAPEAEHIYSGRRKVTREQLSRCTILFGWPRAIELPLAKNLKWFQTMWAGTDEYMGYLPAGTILTSSGGMNRRSVAEHMLAMVLALCRRLPHYRDSQNAHVWEFEGRMKTLLDAKVLVLGTGHIGSTFAEMCKNLGSYTIGVSRSGRAAEGFDETHPLDKLDELLPQADVVALIMPHNAQSIGLMDARRIGLMKSDAILINAGRGSVLDQKALTEALKADKLWGAGLDVTDPEPLPADDPLWDAPNLVLTPHVAGGMRLELTRRNCIKLAQENLRHYLAGENLINYVTKG